MARIPINLSTGSLKEDNLIVGIDLGTTHSLIAYMLEGSPACIADYDRDVIVPSIIHIARNGAVTVGEDARPLLQTDPSRTLYSIKRLMGKSFRDLGDHLPFFSYHVRENAQEEGLVRVEIDGRYYSPVELSSFILKELKARAEHRLKQEIQKAVITVPAYFNDAQREATRDAGRLAGLDVLRIVNEPTAAALAYGLGLSPEAHNRVAVYDLGGGTFDVTLLAIEGGVFEVLATHGDTYLGGDDFDRAIQDHWLAELGIAQEALQADKALGQRMRLLAEQAKKHLSSAEEFHTTLDYQGQQHALQLTRSTFEVLVAPLVERTLVSCRQALADAKLTPDAIDTVLLVGGSTRVPYVKAQVAALFGKTPNDSLNPDQVVALGAAVQADILAGNRKDLLLLDVTPLSLGLETAGGLMDVLIPRNSKIPTRVGRQYTTQVDGQSAMRITVYQGERDLVADNRKLAEFHLTGIPGMPAGLPKVEVRFLLDADGILQVSARELRSGVEQQISVKPTYGLSDSEVEQMLLDSIQHAQQDVSTRMIVEAREEARQRLNQTEAFLIKHASELTQEEIRHTRELLNELATQLEQGDKDSLHQQMDILEAFTSPFAQRVMNKAITAALVGKHLPNE